MSKIITRRFLVEKLEGLLTDEFDSSELVYEDNDQLILRIIEAAEHYQNKVNGVYESDCKSSL
jgi:hypothetical protein